MSDITELGNLLRNLTESLTRLPAGSPERDSIRNLFHKVSKALDAHIEKEERPHKAGKSHNKSQQE